MESMSKISKKTALVVDNGQDFRDLFKCLLEFLQFEVTCVETAEKAIQKVKENSYYIILMEVHISDMSGLEALKKIRALRPKQKVIILSSNSDPMYVVERMAFQEGAVECILKPVELSEIDRIIHETAGTSC